MSDTVITITTLNQVIERLESALAIPDISPSPTHVMRDASDRLTGLRDFLEGYVEVIAHPDPWAALGELPDSPALPWNQAAAS